MADLSLIRSLGTVTEFRKGQIIFMENDVGENMYIVLKGAFGVYVNSFDDDPVRVTSVEQGSFFGEMSVIDGWNRSATVITEEDGSILAIEKGNFTRLLERSPDIADSILETLHSRARATAEEARRKGKYVPPLPGIDVTANSGVKSKIATMNKLTQYIRHANELLYDRDENRKRGRKALLPDGYKIYSIKDENDNSQMMRQRKVTCPYCLKISNAYVPQISNLVKEKSCLDGRVIYKDFDILLYTNIVCPNCNYSDTYREFCRYRPYAEHPKYLGNRFINAENFTGFADECSRTVDEAILSYYLNIKCLERNDRDPLGLAKAWIRLYWMYGDLEDPVFTKQAADKALEWYREYAVWNAGYMPMSYKIRINAILGELSVALEDYRRAREYFEENARLSGNAPTALEGLCEECLWRYHEIEELEASADL